MRALIKTLVVYVLAGPLIGLVALLLSMQLRSGFTVRPTKTDLYLIPMAYLFGLLPALATAIGTYLLRKRTSFLIVALASGVTGAAFSSVIWLIQPDPLITALQLGALPGFAAGLGSAVLARRFLRWPPSNSFKPNPLRGSA